MNIQHVEPPNWWTGMADNNLQIMIHGENVAQFEVSIRDKDVLLKKVNRAESPNYLFLDVEIARDAKPGRFKIRFFDGGKRVGNYEYKLYERKEGSANRLGFNNSDIIYLLMPDRFANGNPDNDNVKGMFEQMNRADHDGRHGGDIQGVIDHLDYIKATGFTALWMNPVFENNQEKYSYHGYSITDYYKVDARLGSNDDYQSMVDACHEKEIKVIKDMIFNHCGSKHWWMEDLPFQDWVHQFPEYTTSNYKANVIIDPYVSEFDETKMLSGWFDRTMPDLNQRNEFLANYLIQNSIWWVENFDLDGIRMDTYPYPYKEMMARWSGRIMEEYPNFRIVGEIWDGNPSVVAYWKSRNKYSGYASNLNTVFDFPLHDALKMALNEKETWNEGIVRLYSGLSQDYLYEDPEDHVVFCDNHDVARIAAVCNDDYQKVKQALIFIMTIRGTPLVYYGTEIGMSGLADDHHGKIRRDFPGGWADDQNNAFNENSRYRLQKEMHKFTQNLIRIRKGNEVLQTGKLKHFIPENGVYVYFRYLEDEVVMIALNNGTKEQTLDLERFDEVLKNYSSAFHLYTGVEHPLKDGLGINGNGFLLISLKK